LLFLWFIFDLIFIKVYTKTIFILFIIYNLFFEKDYYIFKTNSAFFIKLLIIFFTLFLYFIFDKY